MYLRKCAKGFIQRDVSPILHLWMLCGMYLRKCTKGFIQLERFVTHFAHLILKIGIFKFILPVFWKCWLMLQLFVKSMDSHQILQIISGMRLSAVYSNYRDMFCPWNYCKLKIYNHLYNMITSSVKDYEYRRYVFYAISMLIRNGVNLHMKLLLSKVLL
jgi:hypothetical protein